MSAIGSTGNPGFAALNFESADPAALADFWAKLVGRPAIPGKLAGGFAIMEADPESGPRLVFVPTPKSEYPVRPLLSTDHYEEEMERVTGLGAKAVNEVTLPGVRWTTFADPDGNAFDVLAWDAE
jgi:hypothetical protein